MDRMAAEGKCVARYEGLVLFVTGCAPGDLVEVELTKIKSNFLEGRAVQITEWSKERVEPFCQHFGLCGGCSWQHIRYETQLNYKQEQVVDHLERIGGLNLPAINPILPSLQTQQYRNRLDFTCTANRWMTKEELTLGLPPGQPGIGFHIPKMYDRVFDVEACHLMGEEVNSIRNHIRATAIENNIPFFDLRKQVGYLRTLTIRSTSGGEMMMILQVAFDEPSWLESILTSVSEKFPQLTSIQYIINGKRNDTFHDQDIKVWKGIGYITEKMEKPSGAGFLEFRIGPKSFFQTNSRQASRLYHAAWQLASLKGDELVYDLYTGTGTIANYVAAHCRKVIGLEYVEAAVIDARINAQVNGITNTEFYAGDLKNLLDENFLDQHGKPEVIITDPPRAGMHEDVTRMILKASPQKIVYVSCNPATQARDLKILSEAYSISAVQPVDMFPQTMHVENIVLLEKI